MEARIDNANRQVRERKYACDAWAEIEWEDPEARAKIKKIQTKYESTVSHLGTLREQNMAKFFHKPSQNTHVDAEETQDVPDDILIDMSIPEANNLQTSSNLLSPSDRKSVV